MKAPVTIEAQARHSLGMIKEYWAKRPWHDTTRPVVRAEMRWHIAMVRRFVPKIAPNQPVPYRIKEVAK